MSEHEQGAIVATTQQAGALSAAPAHQITGVTPMDMLAIATRTGAPDAAQLERLWALHVAHEEREAKKAYVRDMADFKRNAPTITKDKAVGYTNKDGTFTGYKHASLGNVTSAIVEGLAQHGFSHSWDVKQDGATAHVTCTITHRMGHAESVSMHAAKDDSGKKNAIQQVASAITYLQRYTLLAATGLAVEDGSDDDGAAAGMRDQKAEPPTRNPADKPRLVGPQFDNAKKAIAAGKYTLEEAQDYYALTPEQNKELAAAVPQGGAQ